MSPGFQISPLTPDFRSNYEAAELQRRPIWTAVTLGTPHHTGIIQTGQGPLRDLGNVLHAVLHDV
jgi:hypothetical protein